MTRKLFSLFTAMQCYASMLATDGALSGRFTINSNGDQVVFSQGNLQATTTNFGETWTWSFAENQWDYIGDAVANNAINGNGSVSENGTVDLFGWSTNATYYGIHNSIMYTDYAGNFVDWGNNMVDGWRTMSADEWSYLFSTRTNAQQLRGQATVNGVHGYIFLPDDWSIPSGLSFQGSPNNWTSNQYAGDDWSLMETAGAVFLPTAGCAFQHDGKSVKEVDLVSSYGYYWSSSPYNQGSSKYWYFREDLSNMNETNISQGRSVRLIHDVTPAQPSWVLAGDSWDEETKTLTVNSNPGESAYYDNTEIEHVIISDGVTNIGEFAFKYCYNITSVTFGNNVSSIENEAFYNCYNLTSIEIPNSVTSMGIGAFSECYALTSVTIGNGLTSIANYAFNACHNLTSLTLGNSVTNIGDYAFYDCSQLTTIVIPNSVESIGYNTFAYCAALTSLMIGNNVTSIGYYAFASCSALTSVVIPNSVESIGREAFSECSALASVTIGNGLASIEDQVFYSCHALTSVEIPNSVTSIGEHAFGYCVALTSVTIGNNVTSIGNSAFYSCRALISIEIPNSVVSIGNAAFRENVALTSVTIGTGVTSIGEYAFGYCAALTSVTCEAVNPPTLGNKAFVSNSALEHIYVPAESVATYKTANRWSAYATIIEAIQSESCNIPLTEIEETACDKYVWNDVTYTSSGTITETFKAVNGCDSVVTLHLTINYSTTGEETVVADGSYEWIDGITYTESGDYNYTLTNSAGCDSVVTMHLTINPVEPNFRMYAQIDPAAEWASTVYFYAYDDNGNPILGDYPGTLATETETINGAEWLYLDFYVPSEEFGIVINDGVKQSAPMSISAQETDPHTLYVQVTGTQDAEGHYIAQFENPLGVEDIRMDGTVPYKIIYDGQLYILRGDKIYSAQGAEVK